MKKNIAFILMIFAVFVSCASTHQEVKKTDVHTPSKPFGITEKPSHIQQSDKLKNPGGDPIMLKDAGGDPIMLDKLSTGDPIMQKNLGGDPIMQKNSGGDPIMQKR